MIGASIPRRLDDRLEVAADDESIVRLARALHQPIWAIARAAWCLRSADLENMAARSRAPMFAPRVELALVSRIGKTNRRDRGHHYFGIEAHRPVARIKVIKDDAPVECSGAAAADLPKARNARTTCVVSAYGVGISNQFFFGYRARPYNAHVALYYVEKLRKLIQAGFPQNTSNRRHTRIVAQLLISQPLRCSRGIRFEMPTQAFRRIGRHGTKFQTIEGLSIESNSPVAEQHRARRGTSRGYKAKDQKRGQQHNCGKR
jgi:hypothetical protein